MCGTMVLLLAKESRHFFAFNYRARAEALSAPGAALSNTIGPQCRAASWLPHSAIGALTATGATAASPLVLSHHHLEYMRGS